MDCSRYIGRVGGLAIALGVGAAIASGPGMAVALADDTSSASEASAGSNTSPGPATDTAPGGVTPSPSDAPTTSSNGSSQPSPASATGPSVPKMNVSSSGGAVTSGDEPAEADGQSTAPKPSKKYSSPQPSSAVHAQTPSVTTADAPAGTVVVAPVSAPADAPARPAAVDVVATVPEPATTPVPGTPTDAPVLLAALAVTRRETQREVATVTPPAQGQETTQTADTLPAPLAVTTAGLIDVEPDYPVETAVSPDGTTVYVTGTDTTVIRGGQVVAVIQSDANFSYGVVVSPDGKKVYISYSDADKVGVIDGATYQKIASIDVGDNPRGLAVSADGKTLYAVNYGDGSVSVIDTATNAVTGTVAVGGTPREVIVSPDGRRIYVTNAGNGTVSVIDTQTKAVTATIAIGADAQAGTSVVATAPEALAVSADGKTLYVANYGDGSVSVISTVTNAVIATVHLGHGDSPTGIAVSPDGKRVYVANSNQGDVAVIDTASNRVVDALTVGGTPYDVAVSRDGRQLYVTDIDTGAVSVLDAPALAPQSDLLSRALQGLSAIFTGSPLPSQFKPAAYVSVASAFSNVLQAVTLPFTVASQLLTGQWAEIPSTITNTLSTAFTSLTSGLPGSIAATFDWIVNGTPPAAPPAPVYVAAEDPAGGGLLVASSSAADYIDFYVTNLSSNTLYYKGFGPGTDRYNFSLTPAMGAAIEPGQSQRFTLDGSQIRTLGGQVLYSNVPFGINATYSATFNNFYYVFVDDKQTTDCTASGGGSCSTLFNSNQDHNNTAFFMDPPGTEITISPSDPAASQTLVSLCDNGGPASCKFKATRQDNIFTANHPVGNAVANSSIEAVSTTITVTDSQTYTNSLTTSLRASGSLFSLVNVEINASYSHQWAKTYTFSQAVTTTIKPGYQVQVVGATPMYRVYGDFTVTLGNTTIHVNDVYFDTPNQNSSAVYNVTEQPITGPTTPPVTPISV